MLGDQVADSVEHEFEVLKNESHDRKFQRTVEQSRCSSLSCSHLRAEQHRRDEFLSLDVNTWSCSGFFVAFNGDVNGCNVSELLNEPTMLCTGRRCGSCTGGLDIVCWRKKAKPDLAEKICMVFGVDICVFFPPLALVEANMIGTEFSQAWSDKFHSGQKSVEGLFIVCRHERGLLTEMNFYWKCSDSRSEMSGALERCHGE